MKDPEFLASRNVKVNVPLAQHSALGVGGNADFFIPVDNEKMLLDILQAAEANNLSVKVIGFGTKTVFSDHGFRGLVIKNKIGGLEVRNSKATAGGGLGMAFVVRELARQGYGGLAPFVGAVGSVGGALWANAEVQRETIGDHLKTAKLYSGGTLVTVSANDLQFSRFDSRLRRTNEWVTEATFNVVNQDPRQANEAVLAATQRQLKDRPASRTALHLFRDPLPQLASELTATAGLAGKRVGGAIISMKNPNYIINQGSATAQDVYTLAQRAKDRVRVKLGVKLREEVEWAGEW